MYYDRAKLICPSMESIDGKLEKASLFFTFTICGDKATTSYDRSLFHNTKTCPPFSQKPLWGFDKDETL